jgi:hypothetical protein
MINNDDIVLSHEVFDGGFYLGDYIVLNELLNIRQKWELAICQNLFNGEHAHFELMILNRSKRIFYILSSKKRRFFEKIRAISKDMKLLELHLKFASYGGYHEGKSKFTEIIERAGWNAGIKIIQVVIESIHKLQNKYGLNKEYIFTKITDGLLVDDDFLFYSMTPGIQNHEIILRHYFQEKITRIMLLQNGKKLCRNKRIDWED